MKNYIYNRDTTPPNCKDKKCIIKKPNKSHCFFKIVMIEKVKQYILVKEKKNLII